VKTTQRVLKTKRPKVGFIPFAMSTLHSEADTKLAEDAFRDLSRTDIEIFKTDFVFSREEARVAAKRLFDENVDLVVYFIATWIEAPVVISAIKEVDIPYVVWAVSDPHTLSFVGGHEVATSLKEMNKEFKFVFGVPRDRSNLKQIVSRAKASAVLKRLRKAKIGLVGYMTMGMYGETLDHIELLDKIGPEIVHVDTYRLIDGINKIQNQEAEKLIEETRKKVGIIEAPKADLLKSFKAYLTLRKIVEQYKFDALAVKCHPEMSQVYGSSLCVAVSLLIDDGIPVSCEADVHNAVTMLILHLLTGCPPFFFETITFDEKENISMVGHCGTAAMTLAESMSHVTLRPQPEFSIEKGGVVRGVAVGFSVKPGIVTVARLNGRRGTYRMHISKGEIVRPDAAAIKIEKAAEEWACAALKLPDVKSFLMNSIAHHYALVHGDVEKELKELCSMLGIPEI
jgi:L-fucose isomerase-like protein